MTLIICAVAAIVAAVIWFALPELAVRYRVGALALMFTGASLMWCVDGFFCLAEGEPFVELVDTAAMTDDALLGLSVVLLGLVVWGVLLVAKKVGQKKSPAAA